MVIKFWPIFSDFFVIRIIFRTKKMENLKFVELFLCIKIGKIVLISYVLTRDVIEFLASHKTLQLFSLDSEVLVD